MNHDHPHAPVPDTSGLKQAKDPVCGMKVSPVTAKWKHEHRGQMYFFCNPRCMEKFRAEPAKYLPGAPQPAPQPAKGHGPYTCPMHPEIVRDEPGACPICGMALEPLTITLEDTP